MPTVPLKQRALAQAIGVAPMSKEARGNSGEVLIHHVTTTYLGSDRVRITSGDRCFEAEQRVNVDRDQFCPLELVAAALGA